MMSHARMVEGRCARCGKPATWAHPSGRYCSDRCRGQDYAESHPRVDAAPSKQATREARILARLTLGPATALDLQKAGGGQRVGARVGVLRSRNHVILGPRAWKRPDGTVEERTVPPTDEGHAVYRLEEASRG